MPALQAWARGDSYSDTGSSAAAVAAAAGFSAAARPARDPRPPCLGPPAPRAHVPPARRPRLSWPLGNDPWRPSPSPDRGGSEEGRGATPRLSGTPARPGPHVPGRRRSAELSRVALARRSQNTRSR